MKGFSMEARDIERCRVIIVRNVKEYRKAACEVLERGDHVLEIGCSFGKTLERIAKSGYRVLGIDKSVNAIEGAKARLAHMENAKAELIDAFDIKTVMKAVKEHLNGKVDLVMIDIGGVEDPGKVLNLARRYIKALKPKVLIIKNELLYDFVSKCELY